MTEIEKIKKYLNNTIDRMEEHYTKNNLPTATYYESELGANIFDSDELKELVCLHEPYKKNKYLDRAKKAHTDNLSLFMHAKRSFENGEFQKTIDLLFCYHFQLGQITQNIDEEDSFKAEGAKRSKAGTDKQHATDRAVREEVCKLLQEHKPTKGWKDRTAAITKILPYVREFHNNNLSGSNINPEKLENKIKDWLKDSKFEPYDAFKETASEAWMKLHHKPNHS